MLKGCNKTVGVMVINMEASIDFQLSFFKGIFKITEVGSYNKANQEERKPLQESSQD